MFAKMIDNIKDFFELTPLVVDQSTLEWKLNNPRLVR